MTKQKKIKAWATIGPRGGLQDDPFSNAVAIYRSERDAKDYAIPDNRVIPVLITILKK